MNQIIRDLQIDLILGNTNPIIDKFNDICKDLTIVKDKNCGEIIYYNSNKEWIFYQDDSNKHFRCQWDRYWLVFRTEFKLNYAEIQEFTKVLLVYNLNCSVETPLGFRHLPNKNV